MKISQVNTFYKKINGANLVIGFNYLIQ